MDISGYVAGLSMAMSRAQLQQPLGVAVTIKAMDAMETEAEALIQMIDSAPSFGHTMDISV